ncbi:MAG: hypothetical protein WBA74_14045 [Cyclobacteriaceae bacterium]
MAEEAYTYNEKHTLLLAASELNRVTGMIGSSVNAKAQTGLLKEVTKMSKVSLTYARKQLAVVKTENKKSNEIIRKRFKDELIKPSGTAIKNTNKAISQYRRILHTWNRATVHYRQVKESYRSAASKQVYLKNNMRQSRYRKPSQVKKNQLKIEMILSKSDSLFALSDSLLSNYKSQIPKVGETSAIIMKFIITQSKQIDISTQALKDLRNLTYNAAKWRVISRLEHHIDSMESQLYQSYSYTEQAFKTIQDLNKYLRAEAYLATDLITMNCRLAGANACDSTSFRRLSNSISVSYRNQLNLLNARYENISAYTDQIRLNKDLTIAKHKLLIENKEFIELYNDYYLDRLIARSTRDSRRINAVINIAEKQIKSIRRLSLKNRRRG